VYVPEMPGPGDAPGTVIRPRLIHRRRPANVPMPIHHFKPQGTRDVRAVRCNRTVVATDARNRVLIASTWPMPLRPHLDTATGADKTHNDQLSGAHH
jgi:hypothetical protein